MNYPRLLVSDFFHNPSFQLRVLKREPEINYQLHTHEFYELVFVFSGAGTHNTASGSFAIRAGDVYIIRPGFAHGYSEVRSMNLYNVIFTGKILREHTYDLKKMPGFAAMFAPDADSGPLYARLSQTQLANLLPGLDTIRKESESDEEDAGYRVMAYASFLRLLTSLFRIRQESQSLNEAKEPRLAEVFSYLRGKMDSPVTISELSDIAAMSPSTLNRYFRETTGYSPVEYHLRTRIAASCRLLRTTDMPVSIIAQQFGFQDANYYSRAFRSTMETTPLAYRNST